MKKISILFLAFTAWATAQQKTGINTTKPQATFDVTAKTDNTTNEVEGLLIPRVSKQKALSMTANTITESTMIYVNDLTDFNNPADGTEAKVAEITENGFYHWNGTQWVKDLNKDGSEWVYDSTTQQINLKRSGNGDFGNKVYYDKDGNYKDFVTEEYETYSDGTNQWSTHIAKDNRAANFLQRESNSLNGSINTNNVNFKRLKSNLLIANESSNNGYTNNLKASTNSIISEKNNNSNYSKLTGGSNSAIFQSEGNVEHLIGSSSSARIVNGTNIGTNAPYVMSSRATAQSHTPGDVNELNSYGSYTVLGERAGYVHDAHNFSGAISFLSNNNSTVDRSINIEIGQIAYTNATTTITTAIGLHYKSFYNNYGTPTITKNYGILLGDVDEGQNNWAIYTNSGLNSFGDDVQIRNINSQISTDPNHKVVVADADGTLRVSENLTNNNSWILNGNAGTDPDNNFIGTTDNQALNFGTYGSNKMTILPNGNVGIGTEEPIGLFTIEAEVIDGTRLNYGNDIVYNYYMNNTTSLGDPMSVYFNTYEGTKNNPKNLRHNSYLYNSFFNGFINDAAHNLVYFGSRYRGDGTTIESDYFIGVSGHHNDFHIKENHNIGIGTSDPQEKLHVMGNILASGSITPDYVFEKYYTGESKAKNDYQMLSLAEIENYTKVNKHLPGVPSAKEIKDQGGILVNKATEINLEKIEELYLHTIAQEKELKKQEEQLKEKDEKIKNLETRLEKLENLLLK